MPAGSTFAQRFLFARDYQRVFGRRISDGDLAAILGLRSQSEISDYKKRDDPPHAIRALVVAQQYGVDPGWLAFGKDSQAPEPEGFNAWLRREQEAAERAFGDGSESPIPVQQRQSFEEEDAPPERATGTSGRPGAKKRR